jgi:6-phospho-3-hexuloisomerase
MSTAASAPIENLVPTERRAMPTLYQTALDELAAVFARLDDAAVERALDLIAASRRLVLYGVGREGLQVRGFAMRLYHLGLQAAVAGDMACPPVGPGDLLLVSAGPGPFSTVEGLLGVARRDGARTLVVTAQPQGRNAADAVLWLPAQTMADDRGAGTSVLPMGSVYEGALFILFEVMVLRLRARLGIAAEAMRARHTNLE